MKGGRTPIHIMRWAPADYVNDPAVRLALAKRDLAASTFYPLALFHLFMEGGELPSDPEMLAAIVGMRLADVKHALEFWIDHGKLHTENGHLTHERVSREVAEELEYREQQAVLGREGGLARARRLSQGIPKPTLKGKASPPAPAPAPTPTPTPTPSATETTRGAASPASVRETWMTPYYDAWITVYPDGEVPTGQLTKVLRPLDLKHGAARVVAELTAYLRATPIGVSNLHKFASAFGTWQQGPRTHETHSTTGQRTLAAAQEFVAKARSQG